MAWVLTALSKVCLGERQVGEIALLDAHAVGDSGQAYVSFQEGVAAALDVAGVEAVQADDPPFLQNPAHGQRRPAGAAAAVEDEAGFPGQPFDQG